MKIVKICIWLVFLKLNLFQPINVYGFNSILPGEFLRLITDREVVISGERLSFYIWLRAENKECETSSIVYVELMNAAGERIKGKSIALAGQEGSGSFEIPTGLGSGYYYIRAYSNYMLHFGEEFFAYQKVMVINPADQKFSYPDTNGKSNSGRPEISFFPRGGEISATGMNRIYIRSAEDRNIFRNSFLTDQNDDTVAFTHPVDPYTSFFELDLSRGNYFLHLPNGTDAERILIPAAGPEMNFYYIENYDRLLLIAEGMVFSSGQNPEIQLFSEENGFSEPYLEIPAEEKTEIFKTKIRSGLNRIQLSSGEKQKIIYFLKTEIEESMIAMHMLNHSVFPGSESELEMEWNGADPVDVMVIGREGGLAGFMENSGIKSWPYVQDEAGSWDLELPEFREAWEIIYAPAYVERGIKSLQSYEKECLPAKITGKVNLSCPEEDNRVFVSVPGDSSQLFITSYSKEGLFSLPVYTLQGETEIFARTANFPGNVFISLDNNFYPNSECRINFPDSIGPEVERAIHGYYKRWFYLQSIQANTGIVNSAKKATIPFYDAMDYFVSMDDYIEFPNMEEVFFEIVKNTMLFRDEGKPFLKVISRETNRTIGDHPLYIVDGIPHPEPGLIFSLDPKQVRDIGVIARKYFIGGSSFDGIIILNTRSNNFSLPEKDFASVRSLISFPESPSEDSFLPLNIPADQLPDLRPVILWKSVNFDGDHRKISLKFKAPDFPGEYEIIVQGIEREGKKPVFRRLVFEVVDFSE